MKLLALDTATEHMAVALVTAPGTALTRNLPGGAAASSQLIPQVLALLAEAGLHLTSLDAVAFGQGPGAFTGLRTAVSVAQGLAFGAALGVLPIDSLLLVADDALAQAAGDTVMHQPGWVLMDARMDEIYAARYQHDGRGWHVLTAPALYDLATLHTLWAAEAPAWACGSALAAFDGRLALGTARCWPHIADRAAALARLAEAALQVGPLLPAEAALPLYLRDKVALTTAEREAARRASAA